ncbi:MAG TPA: hypothetical protein VMY69_06690 [Phycisphaerae bacterium]|nr:hypothetical protein [Phycisphaerae bacterium]
MPKWRRDPKTWQRVMFVVAMVDGLAVSANFFFIFRHYFWWTCLKILTLWHGTDVPLIVPYVLTGLSLVIVAFQAVFFAAGRPWARRAFVLENILLIVAGLLWFLASLGNPPEAMANPIINGLLAPMVTLFPLLWPLWALRPMKPPEAG